MEKEIRMSRDALANLKRQTDAKISNLHHQLGRAAIQMWHVHADLTEHNAPGQTRIAAVIPGIQVSGALLAFENYISTMYPDKVVKVTLVQGISQTNGYLPVVALQVKTPPGHPGSAG